MEDTRRSLYAVDVAGVFTRGFNGDGLTRSSFQSNMTLEYATNSMKFNFILSPRRDLCLSGKVS